MTEEQKAAMAEKRKATLAAKKGTVDEASAPAEEATAAEPKAKGKGKGKKAAAAAAEEKKPAKAPKVKAPAAESPVRMYELVDVDDGFFMVHKTTQKVYRADLGQDGDARALLDQQVGLFKDGEILPIFDDAE